MRIHRSKYYRRYEDKSRHPNRWQQEKRWSDDDKFDFVSQRDAVWYVVACYWRRPGGDPRPERAAGDWDIQYIYIYIYI